MRRLTALMGALALLWIFVPGTAFAIDPPDCAQKIRQYNHYRAMLARAEESGNAVFIQGMEQHVELLFDQLDRRCPEYTAESRALRHATQQFMDLVKAAGSAALTFFTMGAM